MSKELSEENKRKRISFTVNPEIYEIYEKYCEEHGIENYSRHIESLIERKLNVDEEIEELMKHVKEKLNLSDDSSIKDI